MQRQLATVIAVAATFAAAATAIVVQTSTSDGAGASIDAAHRPGTAVHQHAPGTGPHQHAPGTAPLPGPGTAALITEDLPFVAGGGDRLLRPDMYSLRAQRVQMRVRGNRRVLRFASMLADAGRGPMVVRPRPRGTCPPGRRRARQLIHVDRNRDGRFQRRIDTAVRSRNAGCMLDHPTHQHWHFDAMASYRLIDPAPRPRVVVKRDKVSFCLRDNRPIPGTRARQRRAYFGECDRRRVQGISPGWVDLYDVSTPGQSLPLPRRLRNGLYCLVTSADPHDQLVETNERNNARSLPVRIRGTRVTTPRTRACRGVLR
jgi:hypothetical protein